MTTETARQQQRGEEEINCEGFLNDISFWSTDVAENLARSYDIAEQLTADHWKAIDYIQEYYRQHGKGPPIVSVARHTGFNLKRICDLFPCGLVKGAYKLAGLPRPPGCV